MSKEKILIAFSVTLALFLLAPLSLVLFTPEVFAAQDGAMITAQDPAVQQWAFIGAAVSAGLGALGAGYAVAMVGSAAVGALVEKPELLGRLLIFVGLAEGIAIYGLIVAILILNQGG